ncbi:hypothetical protein Ptr902_10901 [Pyrenophora tritici-repentis]|nr:hypothetical protein Ptr902_10901 [Pyrenophora tritici-repentis]
MEKSLRDRSDNSRYVLAPGLAAIYVNIYDSLLASADGKYDFFDKTRIALILALAKQYQYLHVSTYHYSPAPTSLLIPRPPMAYTNTTNHPAPPLHAVPRP